jgi:hypothetical protein
MTDYDSIYHRLFSHAGMVAALLREFVPAPWRDDFDLDAITPENIKLYADSGERREADTAWRIPRRHGGAVYALVLLEFQSTIDRWMALRALVYIGLLWQNLEKANRLLPDGRLPPVLPIVLYNGDKRWAAPLSLHELVGLAEGSPLWEWQPAIRYYIIDEGSYEDADLAQREGFLPLLFRLEQAADPDRLAVVADAASTWFKAHPVPERLRLLFVELLRSAITTLAPGLAVPNDLLEVRSMLAKRMEAWKQKELQEAEKVGEERGERKGEAALLLRLLERRFGVLPEWVRERVGAAETAAVEEWGVRVLDAGSLDEVFVSPGLPYILPQ